MIMKKKRIINLLMLVWLMVMLAFIYLEEKKPVEPRNTLIDQNISDISSLVIERLSDRIGFQREGERWFLTGSLHAPVNAYRIKQLLAIANSEIDQSYPIENDLSVFGISATSPRLYFGEDVLVFGSSHPLDGRRYVQYKDRLYLVSMENFGIFNSQATDFIEKKLIPEGINIQMIETPEWKIDKNAKGAWETGVLNAWQIVRAIDVRKADASLQASKSTQEIMITLDNDTTLEFGILQKEPSLILERRDLGLQFEITGEIANTLLRSSGAGTS